MSCRTNRDLVNCDVHVVLQASLVNPRETRFDVGFFEMCHVQIDDRVFHAGDFEFVRYGARNYVAGSELCHLVILGHEAEQFGIAQYGALST